MPWIRQKVAYLNPMAWQYAIYSIELAQWQPQPQSLRLLSPPGWFIQPMISPDGQWCTWWGQEAGETGFNIWRSRTDGSDRQKLTDQRVVSGHPVWCHEGASIVYSTTWQASNDSAWAMQTQFQLDRPARHIWMMDADGANAHPLTSGDWTDERPTLTADGRWLIFVSNRGGALNLWAKDLENSPLESGELRKLLPGQNYLEYRPIFSHDGSQLAFFLAEEAESPHALATLTWPDCKLTIWPCREQFKWMHGPWFLPDNRSLLFHGWRHGDPTAKVFLLGPGETTPRPIELPGEPPHAHATVDQNEQWLTFDAFPGLADGATPQARS